MKHNTLTNIKMVVVAVMILFATQTIFGAPFNFSEPTDTPTAGNVSKPLNVTSTSQQKSGKLFIKDTSFTSPFDFKVNGIAVFKGGVRAGAAYFEGKVNVGSATPSNINVYGDFNVRGNNSKLINTKLAHTGGAMPVCATTTGTLFLCPTAPTPTGTGTGTAGNLPPTLTVASISRINSTRTYCHFNDYDIFSATGTTASGAISYQWQVASSTSTQQPSTYSNVGTNSSTFTLNLPYYVSGSRTNYAVRVRITDSGSGPIQGNTVTSSPFYTHNELNPGNSGTTPCIV